MVNRERVLSSIMIESSDHKTMLNRFCDQIDRVMKYHSTEFTYFVSPDLLGDFLQILDQVREVQYTIFGGYKEAEYVIIAVHPDYIDEIYPDEFPIQLLVIDAGKQQSEIEHRDILGSLMGLGFTRERMGDIVLLEDRAQVFLLKEMGDYALSSLDRIGRHKITVTAEVLSSFIEKPISYVEVSTTVKSIRLDALIASAFGLSRGKAADLIKGKKAKVNYRISNSVSKELHEGDLVSVRGKGRFILSDVLDKTKKDRIKIIIKKVV